MGTFLLTPTPHEKLWLGLGLGLGLPNSLPFNEKFFGLTEKYEKMIRENTTAILSNVKQFTNSIMKISVTMDKQLTPNKLISNHNNCEK